MQEEASLISMGTRVCSGGWEVGLSVIIFLGMRSRVLLSLMWWTLRRTFGLQGS